MLYSSNSHTQRWFLSPLKLWVRIPVMQAILCTLCDKVCQWHEAGRWFSPAGTPVLSTNKSDRHDIIEILLKVALNTIATNPWKMIVKLFLDCSNQCVLCTEVLTLQADLSITSCSDPIQMCPALTSAPVTDSHLVRHSLLESTVIWTFCRLSGRPPPPVQC